MLTLKQLKLSAITAAKKGQWPEALNINLELLKAEPNNVNTLNRLGVAYAQTNKTNQAMQIFKKVLSIDEHNLIAKKHLLKLKNHHNLTAPTFIKQHFIEEPGKTKVINLHRLAGKDVLQALSVGSPCELIRKKRYISVEVGKRYIGALPEDLSFRLCKLMNQGNRYQCLIRSAGDNNCAVYLQETKKSKRNANIHSFPPGKFVAVMNDEIDETVLIEDNNTPPNFKPNNKSEETEETINPNVITMP